MEKFVALAFSGLTEGAITALAAVGLLVLYKATSVINFAHGDLMTLGAYLGVWVVDDWSWPYFAAVPACLVMMGVIGVAFERVAVAPLRGRSVHVVVISTLGLALAMRSLIAIWQGSDPQRLSSPVQDGVTPILGAAINHHRFVVVGVAAAALGVITLAFERTSLGRQVRALAADRDMARLVGVRANSLSMGALAVSAMLAGLAGLLIAPLSSVNLTLGFGVMLNAFAAMIIGGFGSLGGVALAALMIGFIERLLGGYVLTDYSSGFPFAFMILAIAVRPEGIFGAREHATRL